MSDENLPHNNVNRNHVINDERSLGEAHDRQDAERAISLHKEIYTIMHDSENNGRWSGFVGGLGTGILSTLAVLGSLAISSRRKSSTIS